MKDYKEIKLRSLTEQEKPVIKHINNIILEQHQIFQEHPEEILISKKDFNTMLTEDEINNNNIKYLLLGKIRIYSI